MSLRGKLERVILEELERGHDRHSRPTPRVMAERIADEVEALYKRETAFKKPSEGLGQIVSADPLGAERSRRAL
jgi:hypothetical protein